jgi:hypothetical protein
MRCPVCTLEMPDVPGLACHLVEQADRSEVAHVMWLNRRVTKRRVAPSELEALLEAQVRGDLPPSERVAR